MQKKKIALHIIMPNQIGGPNRSIHNIANSYLSDEYEFHYIRQTFLAGSKINIRLIQDLKRQILEIQPDLIHLSGMQSAGFHAVIAARLAHCDNILITIRGFSGDHIGLSCIKNFAFTYIFEPLTLLLSSFFYTVCSEAGFKKMVQRQKKKYLGVIHNAAPRLPLSYSNYDLRNEFNLNINKFLVVVVGRMTYDKGLSYIADAIDRNTDSNIMFIFIGDGPFLEQFPDKFKKNCILLGKRDDVIDIIRQCDLFLFATLHENLSNALLEAMTVGLPVIATRVGGNVEVVEEGRNGFLIPPKNSTEILKKIYLLKENKKLRELFSKRSKMIIKEKFSEKIIYEQLNNVYKTMLKKM